MRNLYDRLHDKVLIKYVKNPVTECYSKDYVFKYQEEIYDATVIIPCYNVEKYVAECMESILKQKTSYNIETKSSYDALISGSTQILITGSISGISPVDLPAYLRSVLIWRKCCMR